MKKKIIGALIFSVLLSLPAFSADDFSGYKSGLDSPATKAAAISPNDSTDLAYVTRAIYVGTGGNLVVILADDSSSVTFSNLPTGTLLPIRAKKVLSTSTTASNMIGLR